jgi:hypothetical protein
MYAQIYAISLDNFSTGKTMRVWSTVSQINFGLDESQSSLKIEASCRDRENSGDRGGSYNPVTRRLLVELERAEVEKLVEVSLNERLLKRLNIQNLEKIDAVSALELRIKELEMRLSDTQSENERLREVIKSAGRILAEA